MKHDFLEKKFKLFSFLEKICFDKRFFRDDNDFQIFKLTLGFKNNAETQQLEDVGNKIGVTRERVRQVRNKLSIEALKKLVYLTKFQEYFDFKYLPQKNGNLIFIDQEITDKINKYQDTNLSPKFIVKVLEVLYSKEYSVFDVKYKFPSVGKKYINPTQNSLGNRKLSSYILIKNNFGYDIDVKGILDDIFTKLSNRIDKDITFCKFEFYSKYIKTPTKQKQDIVTSILYKEFSKTKKVKTYKYVPLIIEKSELVLRRNTKLQAHECIYKALENLGKPSHVNDIKDKLKELFPEQSIKSISGAILKNSELFFFVGRKSTYGLVKWENQGLYKGGTIRDIVEEYLEKWDSPKHLNDVTAYICRYRNTSSLSIISNLKQYNSNKSPFIFYYGSFIGLKSKKYYIKNSEFNEIKLADFLNEFF
jgi:hypothetical protein